MIQDIPISERPRERCFAQGSACLSLRECLALIMGSGPPGVGCMGLASQILEIPGAGLAPAEEERAFFRTMESGGISVDLIHGVGKANHARLIATFELAKRYSAFRESSRKSGHLPIKTSELARSALKRIHPKWRTETREWLGFVPLYRFNQLGSLCIVERGVRTHVNIDPVELFARLLALRPIAFIIFHNHPSGDTSPSSQDLDLTERIRAMARQLGIRLLGHWIVSPQAELWLDP